MLVWYDSSEDVIAVIQREKQIKAWKRRRKIRIIEEMNPDWLDLYERILPSATDKKKNWSGFLPSQE